MSFSMPQAKILADEVPIAVRVVAAIDILWSIYKNVREILVSIKMRLTVQLMAIEMLCPGVALPTTFLLALELLVRICFGASSAFLRWLGIVICF